MKRAHSLYMMIGCYKSVYQSKHLYAVLSSVPLLPYLVVECLPGNPLQDLCTVHIMTT